MLCFRPTVHDSNTTVSKRKVRAFQQVEGSVAFKFKRLLTVLFLVDIVSCRIDVTHQKI
jgi:hypothetical protein